VTQFRRATSAGKSALIAGVATIMEETMDGGASAEPGATRSCTSRFVAGESMNVYSQVVFLIKIKEWKNKRS
jgi:hypothetical protein